MIAELSAAMAAIKETAGLAKVINDAKTDAEVKVATIELQSKLITLQAECFSLGDVIRLRDEEAVFLKAKIAEYEDFKSQTEGYVLNHFPPGTFVYSKEETVNGEGVTVNLCQKCYSENIKSILHKLPVVREERFYKYRCLNCSNEFPMGVNTSYKKTKSIAEIGYELNKDSRASW